MLAALWLGVIAIYVVPMLSLHGAMDIFLKIDGVAGESVDDKHKDWIDILSFSHGVSQPAVAALGGQRATGRADFQDFSLVKTLDKSSPRLNLFCANGTHLSDLTFEICQPSGEKLPFYKVKLTDVIVTSVRPAGIANGVDTRPAEEVTFSFGKIEWIYTETDSEGKTEGDVKTHWDLIQNTGG